ERADDLAGEADPPKRVEPGEQPVVAGNSGYACGFISGKLGGPEQEEDDDQAPAQPFVANPFNPSLTVGHVQTLHVVWVQAPGEAAGRKYVTVISRPKKSSPRRRTIASAG